MAIKQISLLLSCTGLLSFCSSTQDVGNKGAHPNIIYILADDLGYGDLGCYGQQQIRTPNLDKLARQGMKFTQHYAGAPVCAPSRAVLMTGLDVGHAPVRGNYENSPHGFGAGIALRDSDVTIAEILGKAGYTSAVIGKWGLGVAGTSGLPNKQGFSYSYGFLNQGHAHYQFPEYLFKNGARFNVPENANGKQEAYSNDIFTNEALNFIKEERSKPYFLYLAYTTPHAELLLPDDSIFKSYKGRFEETPYVSRQPPEAIQSNKGIYGSQPQPKAAYAACITHLDASIGRIISYLEANNQLENTLIIFSSDNGPAKEGGADPAYFNSSGGLRGKKRDLYEGGIREPMIASWKGHITAGAESAQISGFQDILPTLAEIAGLNADSYTTTSGISIAPVLLGKPALQKQHANLYWEFHEGPTTTQALRMGDWKLVRHAPDAIPELYNLAADVSETKNVAAENPEMVLKLSQLTDSARTPHELWPLKTLANTPEKKNKNQRHNAEAALPN